MEEQVSFSCGKNKLYGILHIPDDHKNSSTVVAMIPGGPQYRIGGHRLYVHVARFLCSQGVIVLRFDYEGLGDSTGDFVGFMGANASIHSAVLFLNSRFPLRPDVILWSLCDGATACVMYAANNKQHLAGLILCNPYAISETIMARVRLRHYYLQRFKKKDFWTKIKNFRLNLVTTCKNFHYFVTAAMPLLHFNDQGNDVQNEIDFPKLVASGIIECRLPVKCILSGDDLSAKAFLNVLHSRKEIKSLERKKVFTMQIIKNADHTFTEFASLEHLYSASFNAFCEITNNG